MNVTTTGIASHRGSLLLQLWKMQSFCPATAGIRSLWWATSCLCGSSIPGLASSPLRFGPATNLLLLSLRSRTSCPPLSAPSHFSSCISILDNNLRISGQIQEGLKCAARASAHRSGSRPATLHPTKHESFSKLPGGRVVDAVIRDNLRDKCSTFTKLARHTL